MDDPFAILDLPRRFDLDQKQINDRFIEASAATHPDRFVDAVEQAEAAERAAAVNQAHRALRDPESRADVLLRLRGGPTSETDKSLPPDLLMEMMAVREQMEQAIGDEDAATLNRLRQWATDERQTRLTRIADLFAPGEPHGCSTEAMKEIRLQLNALRYFQRMLQQMPDF